jgi:tetratricopeptide (TPR) repeat protein
MTPGAAAVRDLLAAGAGRRVRLFEKLESRGPSGTLREYAAASGAIYLAVGKRGSFARFGAELAEAFAPDFRGLKQTFSGAFARASQTPDPGAALAAWFSRHLAGSSPTILIDALHDATEPRIARFIAEAVERSPQTSWILAGESFDAVPVAAWLARGLASAPVDGAGALGDADGDADFDASVEPGELEARGDIAGALERFVERGAEAQIVALIDRHGFALIESDHAYLLNDALAGLSDEVRKTSPVVLTLLATAASFEDRPDVSESLFENALAVCSDSLQRARVEYSYGTDLLRRGQPKAVDVLTSVADTAGAPLSLRIAARSALAASYALFGRAEEAAALIEPTLQSAIERGDDLLTARVYHQASYVALRSARYAEAKHLATIARTIAERVGAYEAVAGAASVLYNVALDVEEDLGAAVELLHQIADAGAKCGNVEKQLFALIAAYEIEVERGNEASIAAIETDLESFDVAYTSRLASEALLPAQVLQLAWHGDFARAHQILAPSGDQQRDTGRRALRWAEIAFHAAAARKTGDALRAISSAQHGLSVADDSNVPGIRARVYLALAFLLLGRPQAARAEIASLNDNVPTGSGRLRATIDFVRGLVGWHLGTVDHVAMLAKLESLREREFGGLARMFEAIPADLIEPTPADPERAKSA